MRRSARATSMPWHNACCAPPAPARHTQAMLTGVMDSDLEVSRNVHGAHARFSLRVAPRAKSGKPAEIEL